ncbi:hypothetical protein BDK51DRAFT_50837 [Blyttiomyces helicus]|uniref:Galactose oxidase n=1 Tax=Blyttiomyces helicus TaxID=388810 RepID=A0A4V1ISE6_9FUNG|nr:hypothetical protein BDK51DRAFT_50837 [Blyttiomyces helicus]|eukprot:RKO93287.1 hypothetical protein BDK51DRAFT_50837 [Blyttiomyces helicus]
MPYNVFRATSFSASAMVTTFLLFLLASSVLGQAGQPVVQPSMLGVASVVTPTQWLLYGGSQQGQQSLASGQLIGVDLNNYTTVLLAVGPAITDHEDQAILTSPWTDPNILNCSRALSTKGTSKCTVMVGGNINPSLANDPLKIFTYDTQFNTWKTVTLVPASTSVTQTIPERVDSVSVILQDSLYVWGGSKRQSGAGITVINLKSAPLTANIITPVNTPAPSRANSCAVPLNNTSFMIIGGSLGDSTLFNDTWIYYVGNNSWTQFPTPVNFTYRTSHSCDVIGQKVYIFGGLNNGTDLADIWIIDTSASWGPAAWTRVAPGSAGVAPSARDSVGFNAIPPYLVTTGGENVTPQTAPLIDANLYVFDTSKNPPQWISPPQGLPNPFPNLIPAAAGSSNSSSGSSTPIAAVVGGAVGGVVLLAVVGGLLYRYGLPAGKKSAHAPVHTTLPTGVPPQPPRASPAAPIAEEPYAAATASAYLAVPASEPSGHFAFTPYSDDITAPTASTPFVGPAVLSSAKHFDKDDLPPAYSGFVNPEPRGSHSGDEDGSSSSSVGALQGTVYRGLCSYEPRQSDEIALKLGDEVVIK